MKKVLVAGNFGQGGFEMRGRSLALAEGWDVVNVARMGALVGKHWDVCLLVKYDLGAAKVLRDRCDRLVWDPLDAWMRGQENPSYPAIWWAKQWECILFDDIIATSPACAKTMVEGVNDHGVGVYMVPHHSDPRVMPNWYNPDGPVVYAGGMQYVRSGTKAINGACLALGAKQVQFVDGKSAWVGLNGASLVLAPRLAPHDTPMNKYCKPQVKVANALAAGIPVLATEDPCCTSLYGVRTAPTEDFYSTQMMIRMIRLALADGPPLGEKLFSFEDYRAAMVDRVIQP